jgi:transcriptional regulator with XRE-family HTH domain
MAAPRTGRPSLSVDQAARVRAALEKLKRERFDDNQAQLAAAIGIKPPSLHAILQGHNAPSYQTVVRIAEVMGVDEKTLLGGTRPEEKADPYPLRRELASLSEFRAAPKVVQEEILNIRNRRGDYARIDDWLAELRAAVRRHERGEGDQLRPGEEVVEVPDPDEA